MVYKNLIYSPYFVGYKNTLYTLFYMLKRRGPRGTMGSPKKLMFSPTLL